MNHSAETTLDLELEPERYELREELPYRFDLDRRDFFKSLGGGLLVLYLLDSAEAQEPGQPRRRLPVPVLEDGPFRPGGPHGHRPGGDLLAQRPYPGLTSVATS